MHERIEITPSLAVEWVRRRRRTRPLPLRVSVSKWVGQDVGDLNHMDLPNLRAKYSESTSGTAERYRKSAL